MWKIASNFCAVAYKAFWWGETVFSALGLVRTGLCGGITLTEAEILRLLGFELLAHDPFFVFRIYASLLAVGVTFLFFIVVKPWLASRRKLRAAAERRLWDAVKVLAEPYRNSSGGRLEDFRIIEKRETAFRRVLDVGLEPLGNDTPIDDLEYWNRLLPHIQDSLSEAKRWHRQFHKRGRT